MPIASTMPPVGSLPSRMAARIAWAALSHTRVAAFLVDGGVGQHLHLAVVEGDEDQHAGVTAHCPGADCGELMMRGPRHAVRLQGPGRQAPTHPRNMDD